MAKNVEMEVMHYEDNDHGADAFNSWRWTYKNPEKL